MHTAENGKTTDAWGKSIISNPYGRAWPVDKECAGPQHGASTGTVSAAGPAGRREGTAASTMVVLVSFGVAGVGRCVAA